MAYHVYALYSASLDRIYVGQTGNLPRRLLEHNKGYSTYTSRANDWVLIYTEECDTYLESRQREQALKKSSGRQFLRSQLKI